MNITFSGFFHVAVIILFGLVTLGLAVSYAVRPVDKKLRVLRSMSWATLFSILAATVAGIGGIALHASLVEGEGGQPDIISGIMTGLAEAMVPPVLGFVVLSLTWMLASVGMRRQS